MMNFFSNFISSSIGRKAIMALTGFSLGLFLLGHLLGNMTAYFGRQAFQSYADHLHSLGPLLHVVELGLLTVFALHVIFAVILYFENLSARPERYLVQKDAGGSSFASKTMPYTGIIIFVFILYHVKTLHFVDKSTIQISDLVRQSLQDPLTGIFYIFCLAALGIHTSHGFWSLFQSIGINHPKYNALIKNSALTVSIIGGLLFIFIPVVALFYNNFLL